MDDSTLEPLLNAAALANHGVEQLIQPSLFTAANNEEEEPPASAAKKKAAKKKSSIINMNSLNLNHPNSDTHKLQTNQLLLETASRIDDAISELEAYADLLAADGNVLQHRKNNSRSGAANNIRNSIVPLLQITANTLRDAGKCFAPFGGTAKLQERNDLERRRKLVDNNVAVVAAVIGGGAEQSEAESNQMRKSPALIMIDDFVKRSNWSPPPPSEGKKEKSLSASASKKKRKAAATSNIPSTHSITLLQPRNGTTYTKSEAVAIAKQFKKGDGRCRIFRAMIQQGFVPVNQRSLQRLVNRVEDGELVLDNEWTTGRGRPSTNYPDHMKPKPVDCSLTFDDLDTGDNRIVVEVDKKRQKTTQEDANDDNDDDDVGDIDDDDDDSSAHGSQKQKSVPSFSPPPKKKKKKTQEVDPKVAAFEVPPPRDGSNLYKKSEFVEVTKSFIATNQKTIAMKAMMHRGYVGTTQMRSLRRMLERDERGEPIQDTDWGRGRPPIVSADEVNDIVEKIKREDLRVYNTDDVNQLLVQAVMKRGVVDETKLTFNDRSLNHYLTVLKSKLSPMYWKKLDDE